MTANIKRYNPVKDPILTEIINQLVDIANPDKIILFGSRTTGKEKVDSDYDICVLKKNIKNRTKLARKIYLNLHRVGAGVDIIVQSVKRFNELKDKWFLVYRDIDKYGKIVYENKEFAL